MNSRVLAFHAARLATTVFRMKTLQLASGLFDGVPSPCIVSRPFFGFRLYSNVSRGSANRLVFLEGERFLDERFLIASLVKPAMHVVDVGAAIGYTMLMFRRAVGAEGRITCVEPSPENMPELTANIANNGLCNVIVHHVAVGSEAGEVTMSRGMNSNVGGTPGEGYTVPLRTLDSLMAERVDFIKLDVEGFEGFVLRGARETLRRDRPVLFVEFHTSKIHQRGMTVGEIFQGLHELYDDIQILAARSSAGSGAVGRVLARYRTRGALAPVADVAEYVASCDRPGGPPRFWVVCRPAVE